MLQNYLKVTVIEVKGKQLQPIFMSPWSLIQRINWLNRSPLPIPNTQPVTVFGKQRSGI